MEEKKKLKTIFCPATRTTDEDLRVWQTNPQKSNEKTRNLSSRAVMPGSLYSQWKMLMLPRHMECQSVLHIQKFNNTQSEEWSKWAHFLEDLHFLTGKSLFMMRNSIQPFQVSPMLSNVLYFNIDSVLLWKTLHVLGKSDLEAVETQLCPVYLSLSLSSKWSVNTPTISTVGVIWWWIYYGEGSWNNWLKIQKDLSEV